MVKGVEDDSTQTKRSGRLLEALTDRQRQRAADIRENWQLNCNERQEEDSGLCFPQTEQGMVIGYNGVR